MIILLVNENQSNQIPLYVLFLFLDLLNGVVADVVDVGQVVVGIIAAGEVAKSVRFGAKTAVLVLAVLGIFGKGCREIPVQKFNCYQFFL